jgi:hypothetical protein
MFLDPIVLLLMVNHTTVRSNFEEIDLTTTENEPDRNESRLDPWLLSPGVTTMNRVYHIFMGSSNSVVSILPET